MATAPPAAGGHARWIRICHGLLAASVLTLAVSGFVILMAHPRLYWGAVGNDLTPALLELPISRNFRHGGWTPPEPFSATSGAPVTANRTYEIFNQNGWARSLHFLVAWVLATTWAVYAARGLLGGHARRHLLPRLRELAPRRLWQDLLAHRRAAAASAPVGPPYGLLQKVAYASVVFLLLPLMVATGLTMSPAVTAALPALLDAFGGFQSARTIHFLSFCAIVLFVLVHVAMVVMTGFRRQLRAMTWGN